MPGGKIAVPHLFLEEVLPQCMKSELLDPCGCSKYSIVRLPVPQAQSTLSYPEITGKTEMEQAYLGLLDDMHLDEDEMIPDMVKAFKYVAKKEGFKASAFDDTPPDSPKEDGKDGDEFAGEKNEAGFLDALLGRDGKTDMERAFSEVSAKVEKKKRKKAGGLLGGLFG